MNIGIEHIAGLALVLLGAGLMLIFTLLKWQRLPLVLRPISAMQHLRASIGRAIEDGKRVHVALGKANLLSPTNASAWVGLATLESVAQLGMVSDRPPVATSGDGGIAILSQDTLRVAYRAGNALEQYDMDRGRLGGITPLSYVAGILPVVRDEHVSTHILVGNFGSEIALVSEAAEQTNAFVFASSDSLPAQAVLYAATPDTLIGEELFAIPAYMQSRPIFQASIRTQDILRWLIILALLVGAGLKIFGG